MSAEFVRSAGVLLPVSSLPSDYGIGTFGKEAYKFVDKLVRAGQKYWQVLPLGPTSYGDSPYQSPSAFAGNPYFIDIAGLIKEKLLTKKEVAQAELGDDPTVVDYEKQYYNRYPLLRKAYERWRENVPKDFYRYEITQGYWLEDYALFMAVKKHFQQKKWNLWDEDIKCREPEAIAKYKELLASDIGFHKFLQYRFFTEWQALKIYANEKGIEIIGDMPIYVSYDSADVWVNPWLFQLDEELEMTAVAGCPPDCFSEDGQKWGNPLYNWDAHKRQGYTWFWDRMENLSRLYDVIRIDHFIGIVKYYCVPSDKTAKYGWYEEGPGLELVNTMKWAIGKSAIIAEDLGVFMPEVVEVLEQSGIPGMKEMAFAFDDNEENEHLPHLYKENLVAYIGTHDNETLLGQIENMEPEYVEAMMTYIGAKDETEITAKMFASLYESVANIVILQMQDILKKDNSARMNLPSTIGNNWLWRMTKDEFTTDDIKMLRTLVKKCNRACIVKESKKNE